MRKVDSKMGMALDSGRISTRASQDLHLQKVSPARTSIAEDAIFIPKPYKRVSFEMSTGMGKQATSPGDTVQIKMKVSSNPQKDFKAIYNQEEGRQTNNANNTHYTQQYDAYGRPRIGFSREPYDFAATKYIAISSELKFRTNMEETKTRLDKSSQLNKQSNKLGDGKASDVVEAFKEINRIGAKAASGTGDNENGEKSDNESSEGRAAEASGSSRVDFSPLFSGKNREAIASAYNIDTRDLTLTVSLSA